MNKTFLYHYVRTALVTAVLCVTVLSSVLPVSCRLTENGIQLVSTDVTAPTVVSFSVSSENTLELVCSEPVTIAEASVDEECCTVSYSGTGEIVCVELPSSTEVGKTYSFFCSVADGAGNTLTYSRPFSGYNAQPARLMLSEIRTETSSNNNRYPEFIELYVLTSGNLWGLSLVTAKGGSEKTYAFQALEVAAGEFITVHYMSPESGSCIDETGDDLTLSTAQDSLDTARDFWISNTASCLTKSDVILLMAQEEAVVMDAVAFSATESEWTSKVRSYAEKACEAGILVDGVTRACASSSVGATGVRTLSRQNLTELSALYCGSAAVPAAIPVTKDDWCIVKKATPGSWNSTDVYTASK